MTTTFVATLCLFLGYTAIYEVVVKHLFDPSVDSPKQSDSDIPID
jgi:hypothetical protein